ncbi:TB2/DP1, HVA22 family-domain-containing protein [Endogone sp. FLAS-F59071]|nr:TB2/DP1, HVA22 family-domain-containing protein [Endogone sp. FLAS-F59071]|eukprot:RUS18668.1 TB2/DP1, HVA22 family-domain-containing protein [Endogone sp. FLAS-F59071]
MLPGFFVFLIKTSCLQLYPAYASYKAIKHNDTAQLTPLLMYWIVMSIFFVVEYVADTFVFWFPFYNDFKVFFILWLILPQTQGSVILYQNFIHPALIQHEAKIDETLSDAQDHAKRTSLELGKRGILALQKMAMDGFVKGQSLITEQFAQQYLAIGSDPNANAAPTAGTQLDPTVVAPVTATAYFGFNPLSLLTAVAAVVTSAATTQSPTMAQQPPAYQPLIHPSSLGTSDSESLTAKRARLERELKELERRSDSASAKVTSRTRGMTGPRPRRTGGAENGGGMVMVEGYGGEDREVDDIMVEEEEVVAGTVAGTEQGHGWGGYLGGLVWGQPHEKDE